MRVLLVLVAVSYVQSAPFLSIGLDNNTNKEESTLGLGIRTNINLRSLKYSEDNDKDKYHSDVHGRSFGHFWGHSENNERHKGEGEQSGHLSFGFGDNKESAGQGSSYGKYGSDLQNNEGIKDIRNLNSSKSKNSEGHGSVSLEKIEEVIDLGVPTLHEYGQGTSGHGGSKVEDRDKHIGHESIQIGSEKHEGIKWVDGKTLKHVGIHFDLGHKEVGKSGYSVSRVEDDQILTGQTGDHVETQNGESMKSAIGKTIIENLGRKEVGTSGYNDTPELRGERTEVTKTITHVRAGVPDDEMEGWSQPSGYNIRNHKTLTEPGSNEGDTGRLGEKTEVVRTITHVSKSGDTHDETEGWSGPSGYNIMDHKTLTGPRRDQIGIEDDRVENSDGVGKITVASTTTKDTKTDSDLGSQPEGSSEQGIWNSGDKGKIWNNETDEAEKPDCAGEATIVSKITTLFGMHSGFSGKPERQAEDGQWPTADNDEGFQGYQVRTSGHGQKSVVIDTSKHVGTGLDLGGESEGSFEHDRWPTGDNQRQTRPGGNEPGKQDQAGETTVISKTTKHTGKPVHVSMIVTKTTNITRTPSALDVEAEGSPGFVQHPTGSNQRPTGPGGGQVGQLGHEGESIINTKTAKLIGTPSDLGSGELGSIEQEGMISKIIKAITNVGTHLGKSVGTSGHDESHLGDDEEHAGHGRLSMTSSEKSGIPSVACDNLSHVRGFTETICSKEIFSKNGDSHEGDSEVLTDHRDDSVTFSEKSGEFSGQGNANFGHNERFRGHRYNHGRLSGHDHAYFGPNEGFRGYGYGNGGLSGHGHAHFGHIKGFRGHGYGHGGTSGHRGSLYGDNYGFSGHQGLSEHEGSLYGNNDGFRGDGYGDQGLSEYRGSLYGNNDGFRGIGYGDQGASEYGGALYANNDGFRGDEYGDHGALEYGGSLYGDNGGFRGDEYGDHGASEYGGSLYGDNGGFRGDEYGDQGASEYGGSLHGDNGGFRGDEYGDHGATEYGGSLHGNNGGFRRDEYSDHGASEYGGSLHGDNGGFRVDEYGDQGASEYGGSLHGDNGGVRGNEYGDHGASEYGGSLHGNNGGFRGDEYGDQGASEYGGPSHGNNGRFRGLGYGQGGLSVHGDNVDGFEDREYGTQEPSELGGSIYDDGGFRDDGYGDQGSS